MSLNRSRSHSRTDGSSSTGVMSSKSGTNGTNVDKAAGSADTADGVAVAAAAATYPKMFSAEDKGRYALITLTLINLLNYIDRYVPSATKQYFQADLHLTDTETSVPLTAFVFVYMLCSPVFSWLADLGYKRNRLIASGVVIWSIATAAGALAINFWTLLLSRSLVGVGEAAYATIAPALLSDFYAPAQRNAVLSFFYLAIPIGAAMGYAIGGEVGGKWGWRVAFLVAGAPGLIVAAMCLAIKEPEVGAAEGPSLDNSVAAGASTGAPRSLRHVRSRSQQDLMFGLNEEGMDEDLPDDEVDGFAVHSELGGPAITHPHTHGHPHKGYKPPATHEDGDAAADAAEPAARSILVRSVASDEAEEAVPAAKPKSAGFVPLSGKAPPWGESAVLLLRNPVYMYCTVGLTFVTFASGGLADWIAAWMNRVHNVEESTAATLVGALTCVGGILGTAWGAWLGEAAKGKIKQPYLGVAGLNMIITTICAWLINVVSSIYLIGALVFVAQVCLWSYTGPINALTINSVTPNMRVRAFAFQICLSHALGDAISPTIVGAISDATNSIRTAMLIIPVAFTLAMFTWLLGWRRLKDMVPVDGTIVDEAAVAAAAAAAAASASTEDSIGKQQLTKSQSFRSSPVGSLRDPLLLSESASAASTPPDLSEHAARGEVGVAAAIRLQRMVSPPAGQQIL